MRTASFHSNRSNKVEICQDTPQADVCRITALVALIFVVPLELDSFVPVRDIGLMRITRILTSECVCGDARCRFCCPYSYLCWDTVIIGDLKNPITDSVRVS